MFIQSIFQNNSEKNSGSNAVYFLFISGLFQQQTQEQSEIPPPPPENFSVFHIKWPTSSLLFRLFNTNF